VIDYLRGQGFRLSPSWKLAEKFTRGPNPRKLDANAAYLSASVARNVALSQDDGAET
jgi:hypothetical protein